MLLSDTLDLSIKGAVYWAENNYTKTLRPLSFRLYYQPSAKTAYFKLRIPLNFKTATSTTAESKTSPIWVFITPEQINHVSLQIEDGTNSSNLLFLLSQPPQIVVPSADFAIDESSRDKWADINSLARTTTFRISSPDFTAAKDCLSGLCDAASGRGLAADKNGADMASLYGGKGGRIFEPPPPYVEAATPDQSPPARPPAKRRRANSDDSLSSKLKKVLEDDIGKLRAELRKKLKESPLKRPDADALKFTQPTGVAEQPAAKPQDDLNSQIEDRLQKIEHRFQKWEDGHHDQVEKRVQSLERRLQQLEEDGNQRVEKRLHKLTQRIQQLEEQLQRQAGDCERGLEDARREISDAQFAEFEDLKCTMFDLEHNLERSLEDGLDEIWERFKTRLCDLL